MSAWTAREILDQLDESARDFTFPILDHGYYFPVETRLHAFRDEERWALVVEAVGYNPRAGNLIDVLHVYGNCIGGAPGSTDNRDDFLYRIDNWEEIEDPAQPEVWADGAEAVVLRGRRVGVDARAGEPLEDVFRRLVPEHRELLLATEDEVRRRIPNDLPRVLQLEEWRHPDVADGMLPSDSPTFQQLARVLETGDVSHYEPTATPNTRWSNWPGGGSL